MIFGAHSVNRTHDLFLTMEVLYQLSYMGSSGVRIIRKFINRKHKNMAISCLHENCIFDNSNFTRAHIAQLVEHFHGKEEVVCSIHTVGTMEILIY